MTDPRDPNPDEEVETFDLDAVEEEGPDVSHHQERDAILAAVMRHEAEREEREEEYRERVERKRGYGLRHVALVVSFAVAAWIWLLPPAPLRVAYVPPPNVLEEEAALRLVMYFQAQRVEQYLVDFGQTPDDLDAAGPVFDGMEYVRLTDREYRLLGRGPRISLSYSSADSLLDFVGLGGRVLDVTVLP